MVRRYRDKVVGVDILCVFRAPLFDEGLGFI
jgi:hypothetical protein